MQRPMENDYKLKRDLPRQITNNKRTKLFKSLAKRLKEVLEALSLSGVAGWFFGYAMSALWGMINGLQIVVLYPILMINAPSNLGILQAVLRTITGFEYIDGDMIKEDYWGFEEEEDTGYYMKSAGFDSFIFMFTMGFPLYVFVYTVLIILLTPCFVILLRKCAQKFPKRCEKVSCKERKVKCIHIPKCTYNCKS